ncbi:MAG: carbohydrate porin [bacterium]
MACLVGPSSARGGEEEEPQGWRTCARHLARGELGGARDALEDRGIELALGATAVWQANHRGGSRSHPEGKLATSWDLEMLFDTERLGLWPGGSLVVYLEGSKGTGIDERYVGSLFGVNADADSTADHRLQFSEYFYEHTLADGLLSLRVGKMDATRDLDTNAYANCEVSQFLNGALVNNPTVPFPDYGLGAQAILRPRRGFYVAAAAVDANAEGWTSGRDTALVADSDWFVAVETGVEGSIALPSEKRLPGACRVGAWHDPRRYERLGSGRSAKGESGWYASLDQMVYKERADAEDSQGLGLFARYGYAPDHYAEVEHFVSGGLAYEGLVPGRHGDVLGLGFARGFLGAPTRREVSHATETAYEAYYSIAVREGALLTLDLQYIKHPGAGGESTLVPGLRLVLAF